ncbi:MAG: endonuclease [Bergeyella cardium]
MKRILLSIFLAPVLSIAQQIPQYYNNIDFSKPKDIVKQQLATTITNGYRGRSYNDVWNILKRADEDPENAQNVLLIYGHSNSANNGSQTDRSRKKNFNGGGAGQWNREHVVAKALANPKLTTGDGEAGTDAHNLRAADVQWNALRSSKKFVSGAGNSGNKGAYWYPGDEWKGDVARIIMYMYVRYGNRTQPNNIGAGGNSDFNIKDMPDIFLKWNVEDPVSDFERKRNEEIFRSQNNRNPFIDNPYLATLIWGGNKAEDTWGIDPLSTNDVFASKANELRLYPTTPSTNENIKVSEKVNSVHLFSIDGRLVSAQTKITDNFNAPAQQGIYIVKMLSAANNKAVSKKIIVK